MYANRRNFCVFEEITTYVRDIDSPRSKRCECESMCLRQGVLGRSSTHQTLEG